MAASLIRPRRCASTSVLHPPDTLTRAVSSGPTVLGSKLNTVASCSKPGVSAASGELSSRTPPPAFRSPNRTSAASPSTLASSSGLAQPAPRSATILAARPSPPHRRPSPPPRRPPAPPPPPPLPPPPPPRRPDRRQPHVPAPTPRVQIPRRSQPRLPARQQLRALRLHLRHRPLHPRPRQRSQ